MKKFAAPVVTRSHRPKLAEYSSDSTPLVDQSSVPASRPPVRSKFADPAVTRVVRVARSPPMVDVTCCNVAIDAPCVLTLLSSEAIAPPVARISALRLSTSTVMVPTCPVSSPTSAVTVPTCWARPDTSPTTEPT